MKSKYTLVTVLSLSFPFLASCANTSHVVVFQHSNFGLNVGTNPATQNVHVRIGIRNEFAIITPKVEADLLDESGNPVLREDGTALTYKKAASSYVASRFRVHNIYSVPEVSEIIATGQAASAIGASKGSAAFLSNSSN